MDGVSRYLADTYNVFVINMIRSWVLALLVVSISLRNKNGIAKVLKTNLSLILDELLILARENLITINR